MRLLELLLVLESVYGRPDTMVMLGSTGMFL